MSQPPLFRLPNELLYEICRLSTQYNSAQKQRNEHIQTAAAISMTSKRLHRVVGPLLWRVIDLRPPKRPVWASVPDDARKAHCRKLVVGLPHSQEQNLYKGFTNIEAIHHFGLYDLPTWNTVVDTLSCHSKVETLVFRQADGWDFPLQLMILELNLQHLTTLRFEVRKEFRHAEVARIDDSFDRTSPVKKLCIRGPLGHSSVMKLVSWPAALDSLCLQHNHLSSLNLQAVLNIQEDSLRHFSLSAPDTSGGLLDLRDFPVLQTVHRGIQLFRHNWGEVVVGPSVETLAFDCFILEHSPTLNWRHHAKKVFDSTDRDVFLRTAEQTLWKSARFRTMRLRFSGDASATGTCGECLQVQKEDLNLPSSYYHDFDKIGVSLHASLFRTRRHHDT